ncbi:ParA family protein [Adhaeribacter rhizoryzae]|uniref:ParA family protein n=1 Tax=Adhaeribacter rhizoryzae TaxID=2607907 RepID=A0A5M6D1Y2_9BACT|nr:ParA family protein [Adhaeribacter rhizoryzae]KAA5539135.1 ParA family protein [Adhaeribacter rhizoryzae]
MKIIVANQKGGVGKSTVTLLLANYLVLDKKENIIILDMDYQETVFARWEGDKQMYANEPLYEVMKLDMEQYPKYAKALEQVKGEGHVLLDTPGQLDDDNMLAIIRDADLVICPFAYEKSIFESSLFFSKVAQHVNPAVKIVYLPMRIKGTVKYETEDQVRAVLAAYGTIAPKIPERVALERIDSVSISSEARSLIQEPFDYIYNKYII